jgi:hypothetical protein
MSIVIHRNKRCTNCVSDNFPTKYEQVGKEVYYHIFKSTTQYQSCGSIWQKIKDSGLGGHGRYTSKITNF